MRSKKASSFGRKLGFSSPSKRMLKETFLVGAPNGVKLTSVLVCASERVKLKDAFLGNCGSVFPHYFTRAILLGACHLV
jgi:hypothetical protein